MDDIKPVEIDIDGTTHLFDVDTPDLPDWITKAAMASGGYPYEKKLNKDTYKADLERLQIELVKVQAWQQASGKRVIVVFEGRDAAGKGGAIHETRAYMNPRTARIVALTKPTETESGQWYFQRYVSHFPTVGEFVMFDRSWYNRAGVEPIMGFCTPAQYEHFLKQVPPFEKLIVDEGIVLFKIWLEIGQEMQLMQFHQRRHDPLKVWKLSPMDIEALSRWNDYTEKRDRMLKETHKGKAPWTVILGNDRRRARLNLIRHLLTNLDYTGKDEKAIGEIDDKILMSGQHFRKS
ncbi:UDP-galactose-lipid carrier transferase [Rhizobium sp. Leaf384]|uniref:polyphosphate kinase 2 n=1 Tax=unclassified Rhizobium TaxID=2613769 RepID=UPI000712A231|nr:MULTISPECIES: polyphosphate kinase 2 [unclassified Rhizobium]KQS81078.1 UDP-galactose-lipid carrier transferase [Rhizobium sp. Leaf384]KQS86986.1 UDP-galactose-lipid carrier transferase [Rhizobium sp. Leaf383]